MKIRPKRESIYTELPKKDKCHYKIYISIKVNMHREVKNLNSLVAYLMYATFSRFMHTSPNNNTNMVLG